MRVFALAILAALSARAEDAKPLSRTDSKTWAKEGWQELRWGMGEQDALDRLQLADGSQLERVGPKNKDIKLALAEEIFHSPIEATLEFDADHRLVGVGLRPDSGRGAGPKSMLCDGWFGMVRVGLREKYGRQSPADEKRCEEEGDVCQWKTKGTLIVAYQASHSLDDDDDRCGVGLYYKSAVIVDRDNRVSKERFRKEAEKL